MELVARPLVGAVRPQEDFAASQLSNSCLKPLKRPVGRTKTKGVCAVLNNTREIQGPL